MQKYIPRILILVSAFLSATGQLFWKLGYINIVFMVLGCACYGIGAIFMIKALSKEKMSVIYPLMCSGYIIALIYGDLFLNEVLTLKKIIAILIISIGVILTSYDKQ